MPITSNPVYGKCKGIGTVSPPRTETCAGIELLSLPTVKYILSPSVASGESNMGGGHAKLFFGRLSLVSCTNSAGPSGRRGQRVATSTRSSPAATTAHDRGFLTREARFLSA